MEVFPGVHPHQVGSRLEGLTLHLGCQRAEAAPGEGLVEAALRSRARCARCAPARCAHVPQGKALHADESTEACDVSCRAPFPAVLGAPDACPQRPGPGVVALPAPGVPRAVLPGVPHQLPCCFQGVGRARPVEELSVARGDRVHDPEVDADYPVPTGLRHRAPELEVDPVALLVRRRPLPGGLDHLARANVRTFGHGVFKREVLDPGEPHRCGVDDLRWPEQLQRGRALVPTARG